MKSFIDHQNRPNLKFMILLLILAMAFQMARSQTCRPSSGLPTGVQQNPTTTDLVIPGISLLADTNLIIGEMGNCAVIHISQNRDLPEHVEIELALIGS